MRHSLLHIFLCLFLSLCLQISSFAQFVTGQMIRPCAAAAGKLILDPDHASDGSANDYTSKTTAGFGNATAIPDIMESEIPYKPLPPFALEPNSDLRRGADHLFSDYVPDVNGAAYYMHYDGTNFLFRTRVGTIVPGAKGYSLLFDTDGKWGATGANADPNFVAATTGIGGNPGFEIEIVLCTGGVSNGIQVYNVDGRDTPGTAVASFSNWLNYSQISIAATSDNGDPDFLLDFYVPASIFASAPFNLNLSTSTLRVIPTTVMSGQAAIGGPKSDIYGLNDDLYPNTNVEYETLLGAQPGLPITSWGGTSTTTPVTQCTAPPVITTTSIVAGNITIAGTWTKSTLTGTEQNTASVKVYKKSASSGLTTLEATIIGITSGGSWTTSPTTIAVAANDILFARAVATGESECLQSNTLKAPPTCNATNTPVKPVLAACADPTKGFGGTNYPAGTTIFVEGTNTTADNNNSATNTGNLFAITSANWTFKGGCGGGSNLGKDIYKVYYRNTSSGCNSEPVYLCVPGNNSPLVAGTAPTIVSKLTPGATLIEGTTATGSTVALSINGLQVATTTATSGSFSFPNLSLLNNDAVSVTSFNPASTCPASTSDVVRCLSRTPSININSSETLSIGQPISGTSADPVGTIIRVYNNANTLLATTLVRSGGVWSTGNSPETTPTTYNAVASTAYYVTGQNGSCTVSIPTGNLVTPSGVTTGRCAAVSITTTPLNSSVTTLNGAIGSSATGAVVNIYQDGFLVGSSATVTNSTTWSATGLTLYAGNGSSSGKLTLGIKETGREEETCSNAYYVLPTGCTTPTAGSLTITPSGTQTLTAGQPATFSFSNPTNGVFYSVVEQNTGGALANGIWSTGSNFSITTKPLMANTTALVKGASLTSSGESCSSTFTSRTVAVIPLPIHLLEFKGVRKEEQNILTWISALEENASHFEVERSTNGVNYITIGKVALKGENQAYTYLDKHPQASVNYYRLKMVDKDGKFTYSRIVSLREDGVALLNTVWPNPFVGNLNVEASLKEAGSIIIKLLNEHGSEVMTMQVQGHKGLNTIKFSIAKNLTAGVYILQVQTKEGVDQHKLIRITN